MTSSDRKRKLLLSEGFDFGATFTFEDRVSFEGLFDVLNHEYDYLFLRAIAAHGNTSLLRCFFWLLITDMLFTGSALVANLQFNPRS